MAQKHIYGEPLVRHILLAFVGFAVLLGGCQRAPKTKTSSGESSAAKPVNLPDVDIAGRVQRLGEQTSQERAQTLRDINKLPAPLKRPYVETARKYVSDSDPDVASAAQELIQSTQ